MLSQLSIGRSLPAGNRHNSKYDRKVEVGRYIKIRIVSSELDWYKRCILESYILIDQTNYRYNDPLAIGTAFPFTETYLVKISIVGPSYLFQQQHRVINKSVRCAAKAAPSATARLCAAAPNV